MFYFSINWGKNYMQSQKAPLWVAATKPHNFLTSKKRQL